MINYALQQNETILYQGNVSLEKRTGTVEIILTNLNLVLIITTRKFLSKSQIDVETYPIEDIKIYNNVPQIKQKNACVEIFLTCGEIVANFDSMFEASKFVNSALRLITGKTMAERGADKFKGAVGLVDDALGINTVETVKNVLENGITGTLMGGFGKKSAPVAKRTSTAREVVGIAKELIGTTTPAQEALPASTSSPTNEQLETLKKMKELVDMGVLTQEEFETKKKQLLGL
jgi:hypothetical protein